jgi:glycosyltransferase involved in cell wall biosynthesis
MSKKPRLYYLGKPSDGFGWGLCNRNLSEALRAHFDVVFPETHHRKLDAPAFVPVPDSTLKLSPKIQAPLVMGYCFAEWPLVDGARRNARQYDWIFTGSSWNTQRLTDAEITHCSTLVQGVDQSLFCPQPWDDSLKGFRVFSGGKFEFRKGQDYVIAAMKHFMAEHQDAILFAAWHNPWPQTMNSMEKTWLLPDWTKPLQELDSKRVIQLPPMRNADLPAIYAQTHVGLFPNRCEAGTNLVMMEYMACERPVIATDATGHLDILHGAGPWRLATGDIDHAGWFNTNVADIICALESAYANREELRRRAMLCRSIVQPWTWERAAATVARQASRLLPADSPHRPALDSP